MTQSESLGSNIRRALIATAPVLPVFLVLSILLGLFMNQAGISSWQSWFNSLFVYAGASQFAMVDMLKSGVTFSSIILLTFVLNLRHALMGAAMAPWLMPIRPPLAYFSVFFITDESWAVSMREIRSGKGNIFFFLTSTLTAYVMWSTGTVIGWHFGQQLPKNELFTVGINFLSIFFFVTILGLMYENSKQIIPWVLSAIISIIIYHFFSSTWHVLIAGISAAIIGMFLHNKPVKKKHG